MGIQIGISPMGRWCPVKNGHVCTWSQMLPYVFHNICLLKLAHKWLSISIIYHLIVPNIGKLELPGQSGNVPSYTVQHTLATRTRFQTVTSKSSILHFNCSMDTDSTGSFIQCFNCICSAHNFGQPHTYSFFYDLTLAFSECSIWWRTSLYAKCKIWWPEPR